MRDKWYADKRDLVKWGGIMHLLNENLGIKKIIQVAYYRKDNWPEINFNGSEIQIPQEVLKHFRDIKLIKSLDTRIEVFDQIFEHNARQQYTDDVCKMLSKIQDKKIVFLDPDTGLKTQKCKAEHVTHDEVKQIFDTLELNDFLVLYQHKFWPPKSKSRTWDKIRLSELAEACGISRGKIKIWKANNIANDVIFFFIEKED